MQVSRKCTICLYFESLGFFCVWRHWPCAQWPVCVHNKLIWCYSSKQKACNMLAYMCAHDRLLLIYAGIKTYSGLHVYTISFFDVMQGLWEVYRGLYVENFWFIAGNWLFIVVYTAIRVHDAGIRNRVGQNRMYTHRIWPCIWWFPCQKVCVYTGYLWLWPLLIRNLCAS